MNQEPGRSVLIAEDDPPLRKLLATMLRRQGLDVTTTAHGGEALAELERIRWDVLLLDLMMPTMSGRVQSPNTTSTSPRKCSISARTLGLSAWPWALNRRA